MENKGLLFIPDISGFTRFVHETDIEHSRLIIRELLELLIDSNQIGLEVSEIEGDAILFYKFGQAPNVKDLYTQVEKMFLEFHKHLLAYDRVKYCQCKACTSAVNLSLKVITHYGEFTGYTIQNFYKLIGKDVIAAHQLLKNDIDQHEYWLVTENLLKNSQRVEIPRELDWKNSAKQTETGEYSFQYAQLTMLKDGLTEVQLPPPDLSNKTKMFTVTREFETDMITLFHAVGDFNYRHKWREGVKRVEEVNHFLPRVGMRCKTIMEDGEEYTYSTSYIYGGDKIEFSESDERSDSLVYYTIEKTGKKSSKLTLEYYIKNNLINKLLFNLTKKSSLQGEFERSVTNLDSLVTEIILPPMPEDAT